MTTANSWGGCANVNVRIEIWITLHVVFVMIPKAIAEIVVVITFVILGCCILFLWSCRTVVGLAFFLHAFLGLLLFGFLNVRKVALML